jgi:hypothetical protein
MRELMRLLNVAIPTVLSLVTLAALGSGARALAADPTAPPSAVVRPPTVAVSPTPPTTITTSAITVTGLPAPTPTPFVKPVLTTPPPTTITTTAITVTGLPAPTPTPKSK